MLGYFSLVGIIVAASPLCVSAVVIEQVTQAVPLGEKRDARDQWISGDGNFIIFRSDSDYFGTDLPIDGDNVYNVWRHEIGTQSFTGYTKVSNPDKPSDMRAQNPVLNHDGSRACYESNEFGTYNIEFASFSGTSWQRKSVTNGNESADQSRYCSISGDGSVIVFQSKAELLPGMEQISGYQVYLTTSAGDSFTLVTPMSTVGESTGDSEHPAVSSDGKFVAFRSRMIWPEDAVVSTKEEAWIYRVEDGALAKITNMMAGNECTSEKMYDVYVSVHGEESLNNAGVTSGSTSSCPWAALQGHTPGAGTIGVGAFNPEISGDGRFVVYTTNFAVADTFGTHEIPSPVVHHNAFLYDRVLGLTWQLTNTGTNGAGFKPGNTPRTIEEWCCPTAPSSRQRGACETDDELRGWCCWQKPCGTPALNPHVSGDGHHVVFVSDFDFLGTGDVHNADLEIWNYHIPTSSLMRITTTSDKDIDDVFPRNNHDGSRIVWRSDADFSNSSRDNTDANQVALATLTQGCSSKSGAMNYLASPDVEVCCEWPAVETGNLLDQLSKVEVTLTFAGNPTEMWGRLPWPSNESKNAFCEQFVADVHHDLSCALGIPLDLVQVVSPATEYAGTKSRYSDNSCGDWGTGPMTMVVDLLPISPREAMADVPSPNDLAQQLLAQHGDVSSNLWKQYLTKTLSASTPTWRVIQPQSVPDVGACESVGSCYSSVTHIVSCNVPVSECVGDDLYNYPSGFVGQSGCCHCQASCDFSRQTEIYEACNYYDEGMLDTCRKVSSTQESREVSSTQESREVSSTQGRRLPLVFVGLVPLFVLA